MEGKEAFDALKKVQHGLCLQEAAAAGVKDTASAQKLCKAMQTLEAAMQRVQDPAGHVEQLTEKIAAAEAAGVAPTLIQAARAVEKQAILAEVTPHSALIRRRLCK